MNKPTRLDVMVSSTSLDLPKHRAKVKDALVSLRLHPIMMEDFDANNRNALQQCYDKLCEAELFIGICAHRYGFAPGPDMTYTDQNGVVRAGDGVRSITHWEYEWAIERNLPIALFILADKDEDGEELPWPPSYMDEEPGRARLKAFKEAIVGRHILKWFVNTDDLAGKVTNAARAMMEKMPLPAALDQPAPPPSAIPRPPDLYAKPSYPGAAQSFTGRRAELDALTAWGRADASQPMLVIEAIGGMGKSALAWTWLQDRAVPFDGTFWYSFYEGGADMTDCVTRALAYVTRRDPDALKGGDFAGQLAQLLAALKAGRHLLVLDGMERVLNAYNRWDAAQMQDDLAPETSDDRACANPRDDDALMQLAGAAPSRILITSRLLPTALTEAGAPLAAVHHLRLDGLNRDDARRLWAALKIAWHNEALLDGFFEQIGRHPLLLKVSAAAIRDFRRARGDFDAWHADADIAAIFASRDVRGKRHHILDVAYRGLSADGRALLAQVAAFGVAVSFGALNVFNPYLPAKPHDPKSPAYKAAVRQFEALLGDLEDRGLLWWDGAHDLYDLHPVVRGYAYASLDEAARQGNHARAYDLFADQERAQPAADPRTLADLALPLAMYNALIGAGRLDDAARLYINRLSSPLYYTFAAYAKMYALLLPLFRDGLGAPPALSDRDQQADTADRMGSALSGLGRGGEALLLAGVVIGIRADAEDARNLGASLENYGVPLRSLNRLAAALVVFEDALALATAANRDRTAMPQLRLHSLYSDLGRYAEADAARAAFLAAPPQQNAAVGLSEVARIHAWSLFERGAGDGQEAALAEAEALAATYPQVRRVVAQIRGELALRAGEAAAAAEAFSRAVELANQSGVRDWWAWGGLARARLGQGRPREALKIVGDGCDVYSAAVVLLAVGQRDEAAARATAYYKWAWADGEPFVWRGRQRCWRRSAPRCHRCRRMTRRSSRPTRTRIGCGR